MSINHIENNIYVHNKIAGKYHKVHPEIFNPIEQQRLLDKLKYVVSLIDSGTKRQYTVLDYGCGSGNLTAHLLDLGLSVVSADISEGFLEKIRQQFANNPNSLTHLINGVDLSNIPTNSFDMIASYSVLHHIPDYLSALKDMGRVIRPGGVLFLDHDASPGNWDDNKDLVEFKKKYNSSSIIKKICSLFTLKFYYRRYKKLLNPRWQAEGDIHVWQDDHIEWKKVDQLLFSIGFEKIFCDDYLNYSINYELADWEKYRIKCNDTRCVVYKKKH